MNKQNITAWFFEGGIVGVPKHLLGLMDPLGLNFEDLGKILYLLYCGADQIKKNDRYGVDAAKSLHSKGLIHWYADQEMVDFSPMFDKINANLGEQPVYMAQAGFTAEELNYSDLLKKFEREQSRFLTVREKQDIQEVAQRYCWSYELIYEIFTVYYKEYQKQYDFRFFCQMAYGAKVENKEDLQTFLDSLDTTVKKTAIVLQQLGKRNYPSEAQKELYMKWAWQWKFSHEMILLAVRETVSADNPSMKYVDAILKDWKEQEIMTPEVLRQHQQKQSDKRAIKRIPEVKGKSAAKPNADNFTHQKRDYSNLEE